MSHIPYVMFAYNVPPSAAATGKITKPEMNSMIDSMIPCEITVLLRLKTNLL